MPKLVVATGNPGKLKEMQAYLTDPNLPWELVLKPAEIDVEETGETFAENAVLKASQVAQATGEWAIADDSGLMVDALGGAPGVYTARYGKTTAEGIQRVLTELGDRPDRGAQFVCAIAIARPNGEIALQTEGICRGEITHTLQGEGGFGYDPIFFVPEHGMTFAEMPAEVKHPISHRGLAFAALLPQLDALAAEV
ncbi:MULTISPECIES: RdgB/HAM1 family non-canonical purine NTP pyrophosphatase [unclassified Leptolyngbya]|uniref:RdgB/HAM1 family non-canonical purine NTP pyrophosphatase n=1 Tax=unclassified Leptolyngbya TaxID=2650499 RepID=UPI001684008F|nr:MULTISPECIES: RdgB/HAM1 family non-canonical purine NTP pyrophosphatase [unclassified Leptolyngbya]MBD1910420.1 RdgB/HAM1 family non-canonical purine NTP pyrophosphatase [Leptolyngbya sp. FACHB-8]MBD2154188.1 RdgB/HAM1 family non-canonical purine NTP pyrophosphatase [Leptolyngbya sp. FACHB-16]